MERASKLRGPRRIAHTAARLSLFVLVAQQAVQLADASAPNIILCMADDLGWGDTGYNGNAIVKTPNLDAMARAGVRFDRWYAAAPVCSPTRGSCLTGRHPSRYGISTANSGHMTPQEVTLAEVLKTRGFATGHFGKWHLGTLTTTVKDSNRGTPGQTTHYAPPWKHGFEICFSTEAKVPTYDPMRAPKERASRFGWTPIKDNEPSVHYGTHYWDEKGKIITDDLSGDDSRIIVDRAIPFIRRSVEEERPFFCVIWFHAPHLPVVAGPKHAGLYADRDWREQMYYGCISALDEQIGRLRDELDALNVSDNTMLWFSSDNGPENGTPGSAGPYRERKRSLREGGIRVPGLLVWPDRIQQPSVVGMPCHTGDYFLTVLAAAGLDQDFSPAGPIDGISLLPLIDGEPMERPRAIGFQFGNQQAMSGNRYKIYRHAPDTDWELIDLLEDPGEQHNIADQHPDIVRRMATAFARWESSCRNSASGHD